jgi:hypothetical protein
MRQSKRFEKQRGEARKELKAAQADAERQRAGLEFDP